MNIERKISFSWTCKWVIMITLIVITIIHLVYVGIEITNNQVVIACALIASNTSTIAIMAFVLKWLMKHIEQLEVLRKDKDAKEDVKVRKDK